MFTKVDLRKDRKGQFSQERGVRDEEILEANTGDEGAEYSREAFICVTCSTA